MAEQKPPPGVQEAWELAERTARGPFARENDELRSQLAAAREELEAAEQDRKETVEMWNRASDDCIAQTKRADRLKAALGSCIWVLNNRHNAGTEQFEEYAKAAEQDAREALIEHGPDDGKE